MTATLDDYLRDPQEIARRSFEIVRAETDLAGLPADVGGNALRVVPPRGRPGIRWESRGVGDGSSDVCSSDLPKVQGRATGRLPWMLGSSPSMTIGEMAGVVRSGSNRA